MKHAHRVTTTFNMDPLDTESDTEAFGEAESEAQTTVIHHTNTPIMPQHVVNLQTAVMESDTEVTVVTIGKETPNQAFFVQQKQLNLTLQEIRDVLASQSLSLPSHFKFMSSSKNIIAIPTEQRITLRRLMVEGDDVTGRGHDDVTGRGQLFVCSMRSKKRKRKARADDREDLLNEDIGSDATNEGDIEGPAPRPLGHAAPPQPSSSKCPMQSFNRMMFTTREGAPYPFTGGCPIQMLNWKLLFRALVGFSIALVAMILLLLLTFYSLTCIMSMSLTVPGIVPEGDDVMRMRMKMSELEVSHRYDLQDLRSRLAAIETHATAHSQRMAEDLAVILARFEHGPSVPSTDTLPIQGVKGAQKEEIKVYLDGRKVQDNGRKVQDNGGHPSNTGQGDSRRENSYTEKHEKEKYTQKAQSVKDANMNRNMNV